MNANHSTLDRLLQAIRSAADDPGLAWAIEPKPLTGGFWAQMWRIRLAGDHSVTDRDLVARVMPSAEIAARETSVQTYLSVSGYPTPIVRLASAPGPQLDKA